MVLTGTVWWIVSSKRLVNQGLLKSKCLYLNHFMGFEVYQVSDTPSTDDILTCVVIFTNDYHECCFVLFCKKLKYFLLSLTTSEQLVVSSKNHKFHLTPCKVNTQSPLLILLLDAVVLDSFTVYVHVLPSFLSIHKKYHERSIQSSLCEQLTHSNQLSI